MFDLRIIEAWVQTASVSNPSSGAQHGSAEARVEATRQLDELRQAPGRWEVGLKLFFASSSDTCRFFGLALVRDCINESSYDVKKAIREALVNWVHESIQSVAENDNTTGKHYYLGRLPAYLLNNLVTVITLCIKAEYPQYWPNAFEQLLQVSSANIAGLDFTVRLLTDLDREIVSFEQGRNAEEITQTAEIKDAMRAGTATADIVKLLCSSAVFLRSKIISLADEYSKMGHGDHFHEQIVVQDFGGTTVSQVHSLAQSCLRGLASYIVWVDINLVVPEAVRVLFQSLNDQVLCTPALVCLHSLCKKGMDPVLKVRMLQSIDLISVLTHAHAAYSDSGGGNNKSNGSESPSRKPGFSLSTDGTTEVNDDRKHRMEALGTLVDTILLELCGCWTKYEEMLVGAKSTGSGKSSGQKPIAKNAELERSSQEDQKQLHEVAQTCSAMLRAVMPLCLHVFSEGEIDASVTVLPSLTRLLQILKFQKVHVEALRGIVTNPALPWQDGEVPYFQMIDYLPTMLSTVYHKMQHSDDFEFDEDDDDDIEVMEMVKSVRKLFVNCCRIHPDQCLHLIQAVFQSLPQPFSSVSVGPLEAALQLAYAFSECGMSSDAAFASQGPFPALINALASTDVASHSHPQVLLVYFDIAMRYTKLCLPSSIHSITAGLVSSSGMHHSDQKVRVRAAYCFLRITESLDNRAYMLLPYVAALTRLQANDLETIKLRVYYALLLIYSHLTIVNSGPQHTDDATSQLTRTAEIHLMEAVSIITTPRGILALVPVDESKPILEQLHSSSAASEAQAEEDGLNVELRERLERQRREQVATQQHLYSVLVEQVEKLLSYSSPQDNYNVDIGETLAHKISCMAALSKCNTSNMLRERTGYLQPAALCVVRVCNQMPQSTAIRAKAVMFLHRMVHSLGAHVVELLRHTYAPLLNNSDAGDAEHVVQVLNQAMAELQSAVLPFVDEALSPTLEKFESLIANFERVQQESKWAADQSSSATLASLGLGLPPAPAAIKEAPHVDLERASLQKQYCEFIRNISVHNCHDAFMSTKNRHLLEHVLLQLLKALGGSGAGLNLSEKERVGGGSVFTFVTGHVHCNAGDGQSMEPPRVSSIAGYPLRRIALSALIALTKAWVPRAVRGGSDVNVSANANASASSSANLNSDTPGSNHALQVDPLAALSMASDFQGYLYDHVLPLCIGGFSSGILSSGGSPSRGRGNENQSPQHSITNGGGGYNLLGARLDLADAQALNVVGDLALLLQALVQVTSKEDVATYLQQALPQLGWSNQASQAATQLVMDQHLNINQFKESFKKIFRQWNRSG